MSTEPAETALVPVAGASPRGVTRAAPSERGRRIVGLGAAAGSAALLGVAAGLEPAAAGLGTHQQMNLPECGWIRIMDLPCPTCGMTTAFAHAAHGHLLASAAAQPFGCALALATAMTLLLGAYVALTGSAIGGVLARLWGPRTGWLLLGAGLLAWGYKVLSYKGILP